MKKQMTLEEARALLEWDKKALLDKLKDIQVNCPCCNKPLIFEIRAPVLGRCSQGKSRRVRLCNHKE